MEQHYARQYPTSSVSTFFKFVIGFTTFISLSLAITVGVSRLTAQESSQQQAAAAFSQMLSQ